VPLAPGLCCAACASAACEKRTNVSRLPGRSTQGRSWAGTSCGTWSPRRRPAASRPEVPSIQQLFASPFRWPGPATLASHPLLFESCERQSGPTEGSQQCQRSPGRQQDTIVCCGAQVAAVQCVCSLWVALIGASGQRGPASPNQAPSTGAGYFWCSSQQCARTLDTSLPVNKACSGVVSCSAQACRGVEVRGA